jgi:putative membrane protein
MIGGLCFVTAKSDRPAQRDTSVMKTLSLPAALTSLVVGLGLVTLASPARADFSSKDKSFITDASEAGATEIKESELANKTSSSAAVKSLADMMIKDHREAAAKLEKIVTAKGGETSKSPGVKQDANILLLKAKSGASFDKSFAESMVSDHKEAVALFEKASTDLDDPELKAFAAKTLPTLKHHLMASEKLAEKLGK